MFPFHPHSIYCLPIHLTNFKEDSIFYQKKVTPLGARPIFMGTPVGL